MAVSGYRHACCQPEHGQGFYPAADGTAGHRIGGGIRRMGVHHTADVWVVGVHGCVHGDHGALDRRQVTFQERPVQSYPHDCGDRMIAQGRARGEVHLLGPGHPHADVAVSVRGDGPAGNHTLGNVNNLTGQVLVHQNLPPLEYAPGNGVRRGHAIGGLAKIPGRYPREQAPRAKAKTRLIAPRPCRGRLRACPAEPDAGRVIVADPGAAPTGRGGREARRSGETARTGRSCRCRSHQTRRGSVPSPSLPCR